MKPFKSENHYEKDSVGSYLEIKNPQFSMIMTSCLTIYQSTSYFDICHRLYLPAFRIINAHFLVAPVFEQHSGGRESFAQERFRVHVQNRRIRTENMLVEKATILRTRENTRCTFLDVCRLL